MQQPQKYDHYAQTEFPDQEPVEGIEAPVVHQPSKAYLAQLRRSRISMYCMAAANYIFIPLTFGVDFSFLGMMFLWACATVLIVISTLFGMYSVDYLEWDLSPSEDKKIEKSRTDTSTALFFGVVSAMLHFWISIHFLKHGMTLEKMLW